MDYQEILTTILAVVTAIFGGGASVRFLKQKRNGGTQADYNKRMAERLDTIDRRLGRIETRLAVYQKKGKH